MTGYREQLKKRLIWLIGLDVLGLALIVAIAIYSRQAVGEIENFIRGFQTGIFFAVQIPIIFHIIKYSKGLKDEKRLKKIYIAENDERAKLIRDRIGGIGFFFTGGMIAAATVVAGFLNQTVFFTLMAVTYFMAIVLASLKLYYKSKY